MLALVHHFSGPLSYRYLVEATTAREYSLDFLGNQEVKCSSMNSRASMFFCCLFFVLFSHRTQETLSVL